MKIGYPDVLRFDVCKGVRAGTLEVDFTLTGVSWAWIPALRAAPARSPSAL